MLPEARSIAGTGPLPPLGPGTAAPLPGTEAASTPPSGTGTRHRTLGAQGLGRPGRTLRNWDGRLAGSRNIQGLGGRSVSGGSRRLSYCRHQNSGRPARGGRKGELKSLRLGVLAAGGQASQNDSNHLNKLLTTGGIEPGVLQHLSRRNTRQTWGC